MWSVQVRNKEKTQDPIQYYAFSQPPPGHSWGEVWMKLEQRPSEGLKFLRRFMLL